MISNVKMLEDLGINLHNKISGTIKTQCPECSESRRNKKDPCLSVNIDEGLYRCHHCDFHGKVFVRMEKKKVFEKPLPRLEKLEKETIRYFEERRGITNNTLLRFKITDGNEWMPVAGTQIPVICFNYYRGSELVNVKFRGKNKDFKLVKGAELIFYNLDAIKDEKIVYITEGEIDCLSLYEAGIYNAVSVPNGASKGSQKLEYLDNCWKYFEDKEKIILFTDGDEAGYALREELCRRLGNERCYRIEYPDGCKDANEVLLKYGKEKLKEVCEKYQTFPIEGILTVGDDLIDEVYQFWEHGYPMGNKAGIPNLDEYISFMGGQFTTITGIPSSGKSEIVDEIACKLVKNHKWKFGIASFENQPASLHVTKLIEKLQGASFAFRKDPNDRLTQKQFEEGLLETHEYFTFVNIPQNDTSVEGILEKFSQLVRHKGCKGFIIDPWNYVEHLIPHGYTETQYISESLTKIKNFCLKYGCHVFLVAHPTKLQKDKQTGKYDIPTLYSISGSAHFFNKTDNGMTIYRDFETGVVTVYIQKVRYSWLGKQGHCEFTYNTKTRQYIPINFTPLQTDFETF